MKQGREITDFVRKTDNSIWKRIGETDIFEFKKLTHSFNYLTNNNNYKPTIKMVVKPDQIKIQQKEIMKKEIIEINQLNKIIKKCKEQEFDEEEDIYDFIKKEIKTINNE